MASIRFVQQNGGFDQTAGNEPYQFEIGFDTLFDPIAGTDDDLSLARAVTVALNTDRRALDDDILPNNRDPNRRGWWGDLDSDEIWGAWPIGTRLWLMERDKLTDAGAKQGSALARAKNYIREALDEFVNAKVFSTYTIDLQQIGTSQISGTITIYRGPRSSIALEYESIWGPYTA